MNNVTLGFILKPVLVSLDNLLLTKPLSVSLQETSKYRQVKASIEEVGLIEPLSISTVDRKTSRHLLLDGHIRLMALRELGESQALCIVANDDETYTYNNRVNRLSSVQEHIMIRRAIERGLSPERLAKALCLNVSLVKAKMTLLDGICPEVIDILKDREFSTQTSKILSRMKPTRQIECAELMISANNLTISYARALLVATPSEMLIYLRRSGTPQAVTQEQIAKLERETANLHERYRIVEQNYGDDVLSLTLVRGYIKKLLENEAVAGFLQKRHPDFLQEFSSLASAAALDQ
jgi:hypothetical protein